MPRARRDGGGGSGSASGPSEDIGWQFAEIIAGNRHHVKCKFCGKQIKGGITRLKQHLAHEQGEVSKCPSVSSEVRTNMMKHLKNMREGRKEKQKIREDLEDRLHNESREDEGFIESGDDEDREITLARRESLREHREWQERQSFRARSGCAYEEGGGSGSGGRGKGKGKWWGSWGTSSMREDVGSGRQWINPDTPEARLRAMNPELQRSKSSKQPRIDQKLMKGLRKKLGGAVSRFLIYNHIPAHVADSPWLPSMLNTAIEVGKGVKPPTPYEVSNVYLTEEYKELRGWIKGFEGIWKERGVTIMCDGWSGPTRKHIINFLIYSNRGTVFHKSVDASDVPSRDAEYYFSLMDAVVEEIGESIVVQVVTDNEAAMKAGGKLLMQKRKHLYWTACAAHCIDLILHDIGETKSVRGVLADAKKITSFIYNHEWVVNYMKKFSSDQELLRPGITRFVTNFIALESIVK